MTGRSSPPAARSGRLIAGVSALSLVLSACGGNDTEDPSDDGTDATAAEVLEGSDDAADSAEYDEEFCDDYYSGETVTLAVGSSPGGGYDTYMRTMAPYLEEELGAKVVPDNQTGGGGIVMVNNLVNGPQDGYTLNIINGVGIAGNVVADVEGIEFDLDELSYIGLVVTEPYVLVGLTDGEYQSLDDVIEGEDLLLGATGVGSAANVNSQTFIELLDLDADVAVGFDGSSELELALLSGDLDVMFGSLGSRTPLIESGETKPLFVFWDEEVPELEEYDIMNSTELAESGVLDEEEIDILEGHMSFMQFDRPVVTGPDVDPQVVACLREAFKNVMENPDFEADVNAQDLTLLYRDGPTMQETAESLQEAPEPYLEIIREAYASS